MSKTNLSLLFFDSPDLKVIYTQDVSWYNPDVAVETPLLEICPPNYSTVYTVVYPVSKLIVINSNSFNWSNSNNYDELTTLPDGLWTFTQSIKPNGVVKKTHYYFRITRLKQDIIKMISEKLASDSVYCSPNSPWYKEVHEMLTTLEVAKQLSELYHKHDEAKIMYNQVKLKSKQLDPNCNC
jgi:hypothetical protein